MPRHASVVLSSRRRALQGLLTTAGTLLAGCSGNSSLLNSFTSPAAAPQSAQAPPGATIGTGEVKVGLILPLSAGGNAEAARLAAQQALDQGAEIILGPLFAQSVSVVGQVARARNIPVIAFSTDTNVASSGVYLLSFLPESDVERIVQYAASTGKRSYAALIPDNPYGTVVEAAFKQAVARRNGQLLALERYPHDKAGAAGPIRNIAQTAARIDALFIPDGGDTVPDIVQALANAGVNLKKIQLLGTGLWDDPRISFNPALDGGWYAAPDGAGYRGFAERR